MVIFGAGGDLTRRKLIPALYNLAKARTAVARVRRGRRGPQSPCPHEDFRNKISEDIKQFATDEVDPDMWEWFVRAHVLPDAASSTTRPSIRS